jgi:hypothetical protein
MDDGSFEIGYVVLLGVQHVLNIIESEPALIVYAKRRYRKRNLLRQRVHNDIDRVRSSEQRRRSRRGDYVGRTTTAFGTVAAFPPHLKHLEWASWTEQC